MLARVAFFLTLHTSIFSFAYGQLDAHWLFGDSAWISFQSGMPVGLVGASFQGSERSASISSKDGDLLFYTNGKEIWNASHSPMLNGPVNDFESGNASSCTQGAMILPDWKDSMRFYIFSNTSTSGSINYPHFTFSIVDMRLDAPLGAIDPGERAVFVDSNNYSEKLAAVRNGNGFDWWVLLTIESSHELILRTFSLTAKGLYFSHQDTIAELVPEYEYGEMAFSNDGSLLALSSRKL